MFILGHLGLELLKKVAWGTHRTTGSWNGTHATTGSRKGGPCNQGWFEGYTELKQYEIE